jgi:hypothetical protein
MPRLVLVLAIALSMTATAPAADVPEGFIGKWISQDGEKRPVVFEKDWTCQYGWEKNARGEWMMVGGTFKMEADGRARVEINHGGVKYSPWFRLKDGVLQTPKDSKPLIWKKEEKK